MNHNAFGRRAFLRRGGMAVAAGAAFPVLSPALRAASARALTAPASTDPDQLFQAGWFAAADRGYARQLRQDPGDAHALAQRGYIALLSNRLGAAEDFLTEAIGRAPGDTFSRGKLADCYLRQDQFTRAVPLLRQTGSAGDTAQAAQCAALTGMPFQVLGAASTRVPIVAIDPLPIIEGSLNGGTPQPFVFDTGAGTITFSQELADELGLIPVATVQGHPGSGDHYRLQRPGRIQRPVAALDPPRQDLAGRRGGTARPRRDHPPAGRRGPERVPVPDHRQLHPRVLQAVRRHPRLPRNEPLRHPRSSRQPMRISHRPDDEPVLRAGSAQLAGPRRAASGKVAVASASCERGGHMDRSALTALYLDEIRRRGLRAGDLLGDLPGLKPYEYQGRFLPRPLFLGYSERRQLYADVENVQTALLSLPDRLYDGNFTAFARAVGALGPVAAVQTGQNKPTQLARADLYACKTGFQLLELNQGSPIGGADNIDMCRALLRHPVLAEFAHAHGLTCVDTLRNHIDTMFAETGLEPGSSPVVALTGWPAWFEKMRDPYLEAVAVDWQLLGIDTHACHLGELSRSRGRVWLGGRPVDVIFRTFPIELLFESPQATAMLAQLLDAAARGEVKLCSPVDTDIFTCKAALAMISDDANRHLFTAAERESIDRIVPWTRLVRHGPVTVPDGSKADLLEYAMAHQDDLILKPSMGAKGIGVIPGWKDLSPQQWRAHVAHASGPWYVIQQRVRPEPELFPDENGELIPWSPVWGLFTGSAGYSGVYVRAVMGPDAGVVNHALGAFSGSCLAAGPPDA